MGNNLEKNSHWGSWVSIIMPVLFLSALGVLILISAGANAPNTKGPYEIATKQSIFLAIAVVVGIVVSRIDLDILKRFSIPLFIITIIVLIAVTIPGIGVLRNGSRRWFQIGSILVQPSDPAKFVLVLMLSTYLNKFQRKINLYESHKEFYADRKHDLKQKLKGKKLSKSEKKEQWKTLPQKIIWFKNRKFYTSLLYGIVYPLSILGFFCVLILLEPDYGTTFLCASVGFALIYMARANFWTLFSLGGLAASAFAIMIYFNPVRIKRVLSFLDVEGTKTEGSYQLYQGLIGFGTGGIHGAGIGCGRQQIAFLPEAHTDFVFAIVGEELGMFCTMLVALMFLILFIATIYNIRKAPNMFEFSLAIGSVLMIVGQAIFNMFVVTGMMPTKGISLPFISYGGSNLVIMFAFIGLIINCIGRWNKPTIIKSSDL